MWRSPRLGEPYRVYAGDISPFRVEAARRLLDALSWTAPDLAGPDEMLFVDGDLVQSRPLSAPRPQAAPGKTFIPAPAEGGCACNECPHMRKNTPEKLYLALRDLTPELILPEDLRLAAKKPLDKMLSLS